MKLLNLMDTVASGLSAQRTRMEVASSNLANAHTTRTAEGGPYQRRDVVFSATVGEEDGVGGVEVAEVRKDTSEPRREYDPGHPDADANGYVAYPNISVVEEMVDMITASRAYEAGVTAMRTASGMADRALSIGR
ncbi:MAG: flagellar basal body rod protein FlgC [Deltaproteobacteria bacterium]|nr:flagellar basal body rod protein FlgC [Deltaproteobacteria bacterium]